MIAIIGVGRVKAGRISCAEEMLGKENGILEGKGFREKKDHVSVYLGRVVRFLNHSC